MASLEMFAAWMTGACNGALHSLGPTCLLLPVCHGRAVAVRWPGPHTRCGPVAEEGWRKREMMITCVCARARARVGGEESERASEKDENEIEREHSSETAKEREREHARERERGGNGGRNE